MIFELLEGLCLAVEGICMLMMFICEGICALHRFFIKK